MLISTSTVIALCCPQCGKMEYNGLSLFQFSGQATIMLKCGCGALLGKVSSSDRRSFMLEVACGMCAENHRYILRKKDIWMQGAQPLYCADTDLETGFFGRKEAIQEAFADLENSIARLASDLGYDDYFDNPEVMYEVLNVLHGLAEEGMLHCGCGNTDLELEIFPDHVEVKCESCGAGMTILALTDSDLKDIINCRELVLEAEGTAKTPAGRSKRNKKLRKQ